MQTTTAKTQGQELTDTQKPFKVFRLHNVTEVVAYYEAQMNRACVNQNYLRRAIDQARNTNPEVIVAEHATLAEAETDAARRNNGQPVPGIWYVAEHFDI
ncbi:hypothetical protein AB0B94_30955 [Micromonospora sp. NPDC048986]|uniref:hypothetical protein n=1 Tax=Micromonospora sp. NPDC048986 TaxID=3155644 RepID=UPI00340AAC77